MSDRVESRIRYNYFRIENPVIDDYLPAIGPSAFAVYCVLARIAGSEDECFPGMAYLQRRAGLSKNTVLKGLALLKEHGLIDIQPQENPDGTDTSNLYVLLPIPQTNVGVQKMNPPRSNFDSERVQNLHPKKTDSFKNTQEKKTEKEDAVKATFAEARKKIWRSL